MSHISTTICNGNRVRYFVPFTESTQTNPDSKEDYIAMKKLVKSFPGFIDDSIGQVEVPEDIAQYLLDYRNYTYQKTMREDGIPVDDLSIPPSEPELSPESKEQNKDCPIDLKKLSEYVKVEGDFDGSDSEVWLYVPLYKAIYKATYYNGPIPLKYLTTQKILNQGLQGKERIPESLLKEYYQYYQ